LGFHRLTKTSYGFSFCSSSPTSIRSRALLPAIPRRVVFRVFFLHEVRASPRPHFFLSPVAGGLIISQNSRWDCSQLTRCRHVPVIRAIVLVCGAEIGFCCSPSFVCTLLVFLFRPPPLVRIRVSGDCSGGFIHFLFMSFFSGPFLCRRGPLWFCFHSPKTPYDWAAILN